MQQLRVANPPICNLDGLCGFGEVALCSSRLPESLLRRTTRGTSAIAIIAIRQGMPATQGSVRRGLTNDQRSSSSSAFASFKSRRSNPELNQE